MISNADVFDAAKIKIERLLWERLYDALIKFGRWLILDAQMQQEYRNLTGNTLTSYAFGIYRNGMLQDIIFDTGIKPPIRVKFQKGEIVREFEDYDGNFRDPAGPYPVQTDMGWGDETSITFLTQYEPPFRDGLVMCTGTEYSTFLENEWGFNVLTDTFNGVKTWGRSKFLEGLKPIK